MITSKDLAYLKDMFSWNLYALKKYTLYSNYLDEPILGKLIKLHQNNLQEIINIIGSGINEWKRYFNGYTRES